MIISVTEPISMAMQRTGYLLFRRFSVGRWFALGFLATLAFLTVPSFNTNLQLPRGSTPAPGPGPGHGPRPASGPDFSWVNAWIMDHLALVIALAVVLMVIGLAWQVLLLWLSSRGQFMFLDALAENHHRIKEPWGRLKTVGN